MRRNRRPESKPVLDRIDAAVAADRARAARPRCNPGNHSAPLVSAAEQAFRERAVSLGWEAHRSGWPDFFLTRGDDLKLVEVKGSKDRLRPAQLALFAAFEAHGITVLVWWERKPDMLIPWRSFLFLTSRARVGSSLGALGAKRPRAIHFG